MTNKYTHRVEDAMYLDMCNPARGIVKKPVAVIMFNGKKVHTTQPYASARGADTSGKELAARYQSYFNRTGRRWDEEQREIRERKQQARTDAAAAKRRVRDNAEQLLQTVEDFISDHDNGLGPDIDRLRAIAMNIRQPE